MVETSFANTMLSFVDLFCNEEYIEPKISCFWIDTLKLKLAVDSLKLDRYLTTPRTKQGNNRR